VSKNPIVGSNIVVCAKAQATRVRYRRRCKLLCDSGCSRGLDAWTNPLHTSATTHGAAPIGLDSAAALIQRASGTAPTYQYAMIGGKKKRKWK
jgi:hypothetical protein